MSRLPAIVAALCGSIAGLAAAPASPSPVGLWTTIDDHTHAPRSQVEISERGGALSGKVVRIYPQPGEPAQPLCEECSGERYNQPVLGMTILWNLRRVGEEWNGGEILDPENGKVYRVLLRPSTDGSALEVRGYVGFSLLGRSQVWRRAGP